MNINSRSSKRKRRKKGKNIFTWWRIALAHRAQPLRPGKELFYTTQVSAKTHLPQENPVNIPHKRLIYSTITIKFAKIVKKMLNAFKKCRIATIHNILPKQCRHCIGLLFTKAQKKDKFVVCTVVPYFRSAVSMLCVCVFVVSSPYYIPEVLLSSTNLNPSPPRNPPCKNL